MGHKYQFMNHAYYLVVTGPPSNEVVRNALQRGFDAAVVACAAVSIASPASCLPSAKVAFLSAAAINGISKYSLELDDRHWW